ncbi:hypothetical protein PLESTB_000805100 [Pleodorina starrii]|uniref:Vasohibin-2 n=1 Tax=Pleodorina starrii TaxID=330485 RepID=A0A9W6BLE4_9CHLO|nr:hypothetical protein PLESTM_000639400 [Pleodorina starrii]GLC53930.1 hypothetical protein PLESTB_000805100 [Pleodorina starrii]GLC70237.1 hypothetical protein PLESTF_000946300 [Pleodorina starrii]
MDLSASALQLKRLLNSLPLPDEKIPEAERLIKECSEAELSHLGLGPPPRPVVPRGLIEGGKGGDGKPGGPQQRLQAVQHVINSLQYNHTPGYYYNVSKSRPFSRIMETAREALRAALPIKCLEAVFLGALLTAGWTELDRLPLAFKSTVQGQTYRHIVLAVFHSPSRKWGALGLSRRPELMDKDLVYDSLADLVSEYKKSYERWWHSLVRVYVGLPLEHDTYYPGPVCWRYLSLSLAGRKSWASHRAALDKFAGQARKLAGKFRAMGGKPASEGSLGGPADQQQRQGQGQGQAAGGAPAPSTAPGVFAAASAARCAKSVSPARRRPPPVPLPPPAPLPRRPLTPSRTPAAAAAAAPVCSPLRASVPAPLSAAKSSSPISPSGQSPAAAAASSAHSCAAATAAASGPSEIGAEIVAADGAAVGSGHVATPGGDATTGGKGSSSGGDGGSTGGGAQQEASASDGGGAAVTSRSDGGAVRGGDGEGSQRSAERELVSQQSRGFKRHARPRRSSDPGSVASVAAAAAAAASVSGSRRGASAREQARLLREQVRAEERSGGGGTGTVAASRYEEDDEEEDSDSDEADYLSEGDD